MDLEEFVAASLSQVINGITKAQTSVGGSGARINPQVDVGHSLDFESGTPIQSIEFDVAVTVSQARTKKANLQVGAPWVNDETPGDTTSGHSAVSRIRFTVPVVLRKDPYVTRQ